MSDTTPVRLVLVDDHAMFRSGVKAELDHDRTTIVGEAPDVDRAAVRALVATLAARLADDDPAAVALARDNAAPLQAAFGGEWLAVQRQIAAFDLSGAAETLAAACAASEYLKEV